jgi:hypothetical protein
VAARRRLQKDRSEETIAAALEVLREGPSSGRKMDQIAWKKLWVALWKLRPNDELRAIAIEWLETPAATEARGRSYVWQVLWRAEKTPVMYGIGCDYLDSAPYSRAKWAAIWKELWQYRESSALQRLAVRWLDASLEESLDRAQSPWLGVWRRAYAADPTPELAALGRRRLRAASDQPAAPEVRRLLLGRALGDLAGDPLAAVAPAGAGDGELEED